MPEVKKEDIRRSLLGRFLPGALGVLGGVFVFTGLPPLEIPQLAMFAGGVLGLTAGYGLALRLGRRFIRSREVLLGKRAVLSGAVSIPTYAVALSFLEGTFTTLPGVVLGAAGIATLTGAYVAASMFLRRPVPPRSLPEAETKALASADSLEDWFREQEQEADHIYRDPPRSAA